MPSSMLRFHAAIRGASTNGGECPLPTFDRSLASLASLPRLFIEPDGSFVQAGATDDGQAWQVDGNLVDQGERLAYVELKGCCPAEPFDALLAAFGWPGTKLAFELPRRGVVHGEAEFRRLAAGEGGAI
jgi:hypothetical protein